MTGSEIRALKQSKEAKGGADGFDMSFDVKKGQVLFLTSDEDDDELDGNGTTDGTD